MSDPTILFVKPQAISAKDKKALQSAGVIVVEVEDVNNVKFVRAATELDSSEMLLAATKVIKNSGYESVRAAFGNAICAALEATASRKSP